MSDVMHVAMTDLIAELRAACGERHVLTEHDDLRTYESDGLLQYVAMPRVVVLPGSADAVAGAVRACHRAGDRISAAREHDLSLIHI